MRCPSLVNAYFQQFLCECYATRRSSTTTFARSWPPARYFQSSHQVRKPPAIAVVGKGEEDSLSASKEDSHLRGIRADSATVSSYPGNEEQNLLRWNMEEMWDCPSCGESNHRRHRACPKCNYTNKPFTREEWEQAWTGNKSGNKQQSRSESIRYKTNNAEWARMEESQHARLEQTKDGKYVPLDARGEQRNTRGLVRHVRTESLNVKYFRFKSPYQSPSEEKLPSKVMAEPVIWRSQDVYQPSSEEKLPSKVPAEPVNWRSHSGLEAPKAPIRSILSEPIMAKHLSEDQSWTEIEVEEDLPEAIAPRSEFHRFGRTESYAEKNRPRRRNDVAVSSPYVGRSRERQQQQRFFAGDEDYDDHRAKNKKKQKRPPKNEKAAQRSTGPPIPIHLPEFIAVSNLAAALKVKVEDFGSRMLALGFKEINNDHILDAETAGLIAAEFNYEPIVDTGETDDLLPLPLAEDVSSLPSRPPVVTIMGHVDHGKTTLLDWLRKSSVAATEHGGITQHIGAFSVSMPGGRLITFLDTPGHAAFLSMRKRGASVTDIVVLVVAADDSVKPQTLEAISHAQAAKVPVIVAVNKIDKEDANPEQVKHDLARHGVQIEDFGGETQVVCVSGKTGQGMVELEDAVIALADVLDMRAETDGQAEGWVLEATTKNAGRIATVLVKRGTIRPGDIIVAGSTWAKVRCLRNEAGVQIPAAGPGTPVEIEGWKEQPEAGDEVLQATDEQKAKLVVKYRIEVKKKEQMAEDMIAINESRRLEQTKRELEKEIEKQKEQSSNAGQSITGIPSHIPETPSPGANNVNFIIKADVSGSVEAVFNNISALGNSEIRPHVLRYGVGSITEFDIEHATSAKGHIIAFNITIEPRIARMAELAGVKILDQKIIYKLVDDVTQELSEHLPPSVIKKVVGEAEIAQVFEITAKGHIKIPVAGCKVRNGVVSRNAKVRVLRGQDMIHEGTISSLKSVKKDVAEMRKGTECGMSFHDWADFLAGDQVQCYEEKTEKRYL